ncbi:MAG: family 10 glycosylhydrolase [Gemmatimonadaceae bacterium]|nr:family 10 glycosylhydrolase [Gemmatimonadaceae bacterium]
MRYPRRSKLTVVAIALLFSAACRSDGPTAVVIPPPTTLTVPAINREFRGLWVATVANIDWPSRTGMSLTAQQTELATILDVARSTGLNAVILQVRAAGDAIFPSTLEPWSRSLTGTQGVDPGWDPLAYAVNEAHARGVELHAWFNPFRAANLSDSARLDPLHFARRRPELTRPYCTQLWFDPAEDAVQQQAISVVRDVIARYDVDAVHVDDFFYPYPDTRCPNLDFPDSASYGRYQAGGGALSRADWRRANVNRFVERLYVEAHAQRNTVRVGISPFGIWRPGNPAGITGLDAYGSIYADSRFWLQQGWVDYFAPQLYWSIASTGQSFPALLDWWTQQNTRQRHLWPGLAAYRVADGSSSAFPATEIASQIQLARQRSATTGGPTGTVLYNTTSIRDNHGALTTTLSTSTFAAPALPPATPWLDGVAPPTPQVAVDKSSGSSSSLRVDVTATSGKPLSWWLIRWRNGTAWSQRVAPGSQNTHFIPSTGVGGATNAIVINAVDKVGNASGDAVWRQP